ncbi:MAG: flagellar hook-associated protein 3 FlgL [Gammaproteobacteria bacterium]|jgi:flagellar hook-associated protein 3 FlgL
MRISTSQIYQQNIQSFARQQEKLSTLQQQVSTGTRILKPSDDPAASTKVLELQEQFGLINQYQRNIDFAETRLQLQENSVSSIENVLIRVKELSLQGNNATQDFESRKAIALEIDQLNLELLAIANTLDSNGEYLFAGFQNASQPFTESITGSISHVVFNGDSGEREMQISLSRKMNVDTQGRDLFMSIPTANALNEVTAAGNVGSSELAPAHVFDVGNYVADTYTIVFDTVSSTPGTVYSISNSAGNIVASGTYTDSEDIDFMGIRTSVTGTPANSDSFTISQGQYQSVFEILSTLSESLKLAGSTPAIGGSYTLGTIPTFDFSLASGEPASFEIDGNLISLNADYSDLSGLTTDIQNQIDVAVGVGIYAINNNGSTLSISRVATGSTSLAPVVDNFDGDTDVDGTLATSGTARTAAVSVTDYSGGADISFDVDGYSVGLNANYSNLAGVTLEIQADLNALAGAGVYAVNDDGTNITIAKVVSGVASVAPVIDNPSGGGTNQAEFTGSVLVNGIGGTNAVVNFIADGVAENGSGDANIHQNIAQSLTDISAGFIQSLEARTRIGARLNALESQSGNNEAQIISIRETISVLRDTDLAAAISQISLEQTTLEAAQAVFARVTGSSLFDFLR